MSIARPRALTSAWIALIAITAASVWTAEYAPWRLVAVAAIMGIAAVKGGVILWRFMDVGAAPAGIRGYMASWTAGCALMIFAGYWYGGSAS